MYCTNCGAEVDKNDSFCLSCGAALNAAPQPQAHVIDEASDTFYETPVEYVEPSSNAQGGMTYEQYVNFHKEREARDYLASVEEHVSFLTKRVTWYSTIGAMLAVLFIVSGISADYCSTFTAAGAGIVTSAIFFIMTAALAFVFPFGFIPVVDFVRRNGFFVWGWVMIIVLFAVVVTFAAFACIPYAIYIFHELKKAKAECATLRADLGVAAA